MKSCKLKVKTRQLKRTNKSISYPTITDIDGIEYFVVCTAYSTKFNIELEYGRMITKTHGAKLILTEALKTVILKNKAVPEENPGELPSRSTIYELRRRLNKNPYKSYTEWVESTDPDKPKKVTFLNERDNPTIITDYFGVKYLVHSARITSSGVVLAMGKPLETYKHEHKKGKGIIITQELAEFIKKHRYYPIVEYKKLSIDSVCSRNIRKILGYDKDSVEEVNTWLAAHLVEIKSMSANKFVSLYLKDMNMGKGGVIKYIKQGLYLLEKWSKSTEKEHRTLFRIVRTLDTKNAKSTTAVNKNLSTYIPYQTARVCVKAYKVLTLAEEYNHPIPKEYKGIVKKKKL